MTPDAKEYFTRTEEDKQQKNIDMYESGVTAGKGAIDQYYSTFLSSADDWFQTGGGTGKYFDEWWSDTTDASDLYASNDG